MVTPGAKRDAVVHAQKAFGVSERRACTVIGIARRVMRYVSRRSDDGPLRARLRALAAERRRSGRKRALGTRAPLAVPLGPNQCWALDFVSDALVCGQRFRELDTRNYPSRLSGRSDLKLHSGFVVG